MFQSASSLPPKDGSNMNDKPASLPARIEGRVYNFNLRGSLVGGSDKNPRVFYIGPVHDPSVTLENDFLVFFSPLRREHGMDPKYLKTREECFDKVDLPKFNLPVDTGYAYVTKASRLRKGPWWMDSFKWKAGMLKEIQANMQKNYGERRAKGEFSSIIESLSGSGVRDNKGKGVNNRRGGRPS